MSAEKGMHAIAVRKGRGEGGGATKEQMGDGPLTCVLLQPCQELLLLLLLLLLPQDRQTW